MNHWVNCFSDEMDKDKYPNYNGSRIYFKEISQIRTQTENGFFISQPDKGDQIISIFSTKMVTIK